MGFNMAHRVAVDIDTNCADAFCRSHNFDHRVGPVTMEWNSDHLPSSLFIEGDVLDARWYHLFGTESYDLSMLSPPCPSWSRATNCPGLAKHEGRLTIHAWALMHLVRPKVVCMEMVGSMKQHEHWTFIRMMINWAGYNIRFAPILNLSEFTPQHRERLILVATLDGHDHFPHICQAWPATQRQSLESFLNIMQLTEPWISQTKLEPTVLQMYLDPNLLPKNGECGPRPAKKSKKDLESYRFRHRDGIFGCIMASYGSGHELPNTSLSRFGLYGTLLAQASGIRFLSIPEVAIAHSALVPFWLPADHKVAMKILGNAITSPHAMVAITNAMAFIAGLTGVEIQEMMLQIMNARFTSQNMRWEMRGGGYLFTKDLEVCQPTLQMHAFQKITVSSPTEQFIFHAESEIRLWDAMRLLTGPSIPSEIFLLPAGQLEAKISLPEKFEVSDQDVTLFASVPSVLGIGSQRFALGAHQATCIAVLTGEGMYVLRRDPGTTVQDVITIMNHHAQIRTTHLVGMLGEKHQEQTLCPNAVIARDRESAADNLQVLEFVQPKIQDGLISFVSSHQALTQFVEFLQDVGLSEMMPALGWMFVTDVESFIQNRTEAVLMVRKPSALALNMDEAVFCLAVSLFFSQRSVHGHFQRQSQPSGAGSSFGMSGCGMS